MLTLKPEYQLLKSSVFFILLSAITAQAFAQTNSKETINSNIFSARYNHQAQAFQNKLWVIGGYGRKLNNDIWLSDNGTDWKQIHTNKALPESFFSPRFCHHLTTFKGKLWLIGGRDLYKNQSDIWSSSDGISWTQVSADAGFAARQKHQSITFKGKLWIVGGKALGSFLNDVWSSSDGVNWEKATSKPGFSARDSHQLSVFKGKLWLIGGYDGEHKNDIWYSSNGHDWKQAPNSAGFSPRYNHQVSVFKNKLWLIGGRDAKGRKNDVWSSSDGLSWKQVLTSSKNKVSRQSRFSAREAHQLIASEDKLWLIGGYDSDEGSKNDVWQSSDGKNWRKIILKASNKN